MPGYVRWGSGPAPAFSQSQLRPRAASCAPCSGLDAPASVWAPAAAATTAAPSSRCRPLPAAWPPPGVQVIEDGEGTAVGEVQQRWHLWKRRYDLYLGRRQFAAIEGGLLAWDFELRDQAGQTLALIDRNFQGEGSLVAEVDPW